MSSIQLAAEPLLDRSLKPLPDWPAHWLEDEATDDRTADPSIAAAFGIATEFVDVRMILRRWQAARAAGNALPQYEDLALGGLGRYADEMAVLRVGPSGDGMILRSGPLFDTLVGLPCSTKNVSSFPHAARYAIESALDMARHQSSPQMALCRALVDGMVTTVETLALPLACRWPGEYFILFLRPRSNPLNLARLLINATHEGIMALSPVEGDKGVARDYHILSINNAAAHFLGSTSEALQFKLLSQALAGAGLPIDMKLFQARARQSSGSAFPMEYDLNGVSMSLQVGVARADGILAVTLTDVRDLRARETLFRSLFDDNPVPMYVLSRDGSRFLNVNDAALRLYGYKRPAFFALAFEDLRVGGQRPDSEGYAAEAGEISTRHRTSSGREMDILEYQRDILVDGEEATLSTIVDVTERKRAEAHVRYLAHHDPLTRLGNRSLFKDAVDKAFERAREVGSRFWVLLVDLDDFKVVNDTLGHAAGDALLVDVAGRLIADIGDNDVVARLGGDEFAVMIDGERSRAEIDALARTLIASISSVETVDGVEISIGASIGAAFGSVDAAETGNLLKCADLALYRAKRGAKGTVEFYQPEMDAQMRDRRELEMELRSADIGREFELHYQPILCVQSGTLRGFEALLRWNNPKRGMVRPDHFIPLAEETGVIHQLGRFVLAEACREAMAWPAELVVAVNVSPVQFRKGELVGSVASALSESRLSPDRLEVEITESVLLADSDTNLETLRKLSALGVRIALDDFGTGYSSMSYLRQFAFSRIKIDRSFIREINQQPESLAIVRAIIGLGASLGINTTAEGVETVAQLETLRSEKCGELQGFLFSPPVPQSSVGDIIGAYFEPEARVA